MRPLAVMTCVALGGCRGMVTPVSPQAGVTGIVRACIGGVATPVEQVLVEIAGTGMTAVTGSGGRFTFTNLPAGVVLQFVAQQPGYGPGTATVTTTAGQMVEITIDIPGGPSRVMLSSATLDLLPGDGSQLSATVVDCFGNVVQGATVTWSSGDTAVATVSANGLVTASGVGATAITATSEGVSDVTQVTVTGGPTGTDDVVLLSGGATGQAVVLADGRFETSGTPVCANDLLRTTTSSNVPLAGNMMKPGVCPPAELVVLSPARAVFYEVQPSQLPWTDQLGDQVTATLEPVVDVEVIIWTEPGASTAILDVLYTNAQAILANSRAGLALAPATPLYQAVAAGEVGSGCSTVAVAKAKGHYDAERLNVYAVQAIDDGTEWGWYCYQHGVPNAIYLDANFAGVNTLIHELGHALGLIEPRDGHLDGLAGMPGDGSSNIMWKTDGGAGSEITLGQVFRMSLDDRSWVNTPRPSGKTVRAAALSGPAETITCPCATYDAAGACPALGLTDPAPATTTSGVPPVCVGTLVEPAYPLDCSTDATFTATFYQSASSSTQLSGPVVWIFDTTILDTVSVTKYGGLGGIAPYYELIVRGKKGGTTDVVVYGGGPSSKATAKVTVGC